MGYKQGEVVSLMIHLGDRLGIYRALDRAGPVIAEALAARTGLHPRWLLEWLRGQAAAGLLDTADGLVFELTPEAAVLLADEEGSVWFAAGDFQGAATTEQAVDRLAESFRTGDGLSFDDFGPAAAVKVERMLGPWSRLALVRTILPVLDGVTGGWSPGSASPTSAAAAAAACSPWPPRSRAPASTATIRRISRSDGHAATSSSED
jgi:hypothetical protein